MSFTTPPNSITTRLQGNETDYAYPNPYRDYTILTYQMDQQGYVGIRVYNADGRLVKVLFEGVKEPGRHEVSWDGSDEAGNKLNPGLYVFSLIKSKTIITESVLLMR